MSRIFWDTNVFIYLFENYGPLSVKTVEIRERMLDRGDQLLTSAMTLGELLVKPTERADELQRTRYENAVTTTAVVIPFDAAAARIYAAIRCDRAIRPPDAIQLACAAREGVDMFITNDDRLAGKHFHGIQFIVPLKAAVL